MVTKKKIPDLVDRPSEDTNKDENKNKNEENEENVENKENKEQKEEKEEKEQKEPKEQKESEEIKVEHKKENERNQNSHGHRLEKSEFSIESISQDTTNKEMLTDFLTCGEVKDDGKSEKLLDFLDFHSKTTSAPLE